ncbi:hypothetical protein HOO65_060405 [Ceratocystis lukuohia]|uniref:FAD/NAD(P)-binding domain-containing protein n=2 Tax=Ceratocystis TaxID=5157 RepID=A0A0F8BRP2_CERFI|nr:hypothetical protein CFO_g2408 [Ceratocystis platani]
MPALIRPATRVLVVGGSYAGLSATVNLLDLASGLQPRIGHSEYKHHPEAKTLPIEITIVDERDGFFHLIGGPLAFASTKFAERFWVKFADIPDIQRPNVRFIHGSVQKIDPAQKKATILEHLAQKPRQENYDYVLCSSGLRRRFPSVPLSLTREEYLEEAQGQISRSTKAPKGVLVVGGGAVGIEMAAELKSVQPDVKVWLAHSRTKLLSAEALCDAAKDASLDLLRESGVEPLMEHRLESVKETTGADGSVTKEVTFTNGHKLEVSEVIMALSSPTATSSYLPSSAVNSEGYIKIEPSLCFVEDTPNHKSHFALGDIAQWSGIKRCGGAMHMGYHAAYNVHQSILADIFPDYKPEFNNLDEFPPVIGLAVGKKALATGGPDDVKFGEDVMEMYFRDDLGFSICWDYMGLGGRVTKNKEN